MKVLVADKFEKSGLDGLAALGVDLYSEPDLKDENLQARLHDLQPDVLVVRSTKVTAPMIEGSGLKVIIRAGAGYNTIDVAAATASDVAVSNCPGKNAAAVAELAFGLMIAADRHIPENVADLRAGKWNKKAHGKARGLCGRTLGLIGMGNIGKEMVVRAQAFGMKIAAYTKSISDAEARAMGIDKMDSLTDLARESDFISVHVSMTPERRGMLNAAFFGAMRDGAVFVNTSRAEVVDQPALEQALATKNIKAALDVFDGEPATPEGEYDGSLRHNPKVYCTHHIGASTDQAQEAVADETVRIVKVFLNSGEVPNRVN